MPQRTITTIEGLVAAGLAPAANRKALGRVAERYAVAVTPAVAALIDKNRPDDPIARQFLPDPRELNITPEERADPIGDARFTPVKGIVHRYPDRVLLKPVLVCPVYCRFCFRREMVGPTSQGQLTPTELEAALGYVAAHPSIWEVIVTGGDPLVMSPRRVKALGLAIAAIPHVKVIRWHTRMPIAAPERVTVALVSALSAPARPVYVAIHANHPSELSATARAAIARLSGAGISLLSQTVLLRGINDNAETLETLMRLFVENRVKPYYLHHADLAPGTAHFRTTVAAGRALVRALRQRLSGIAQPTYVLDIPGGDGKVPLTPDYFRAAEPDGPFTVLDAAGRAHAYPEAISPSAIPKV